MLLQFQYLDDLITLNVEPDGDGWRVCLPDGTEHRIRAARLPGKVMQIAESGPGAGALSRLEQALLSFHALGVRTNVDYLLAIVRHPAFRAGELSADFLRQHFDGWKPQTDLPTDILLTLAAEAVTEGSQSIASSTVTGSDAYSSWRAGGAWRNTCLIIS